MVVALLAQALPGFVLVCVIFTIVLKVFTDDPANLPIGLTALVVHTDTRVTSYTMTFVTFPKLSSMFQPRRTTPDDA